MTIAEILKKEELFSDDLISLLSINDRDDLELLRKKSYSVMKENVGEKVYLRGLVEFSNYCINDCYYCGIRKSNFNVKRYTLEKDEILEAAKWCAEQGYGSFVLQSGERSDEKFIGFVEDLVKTIKKETISEHLPSGLGITLCIGEQSRENYQRLYDAGSHRYLLRIETSSPELYKQLHPKEQKLENRIECIKLLKETGFQVGTGVMIGFPGQSLEDLVHDIKFFKEHDIDMIGMGPFIVHNQTQYAGLKNEYDAKKEETYKLALKMIAVTRIFLKDVNIASTTALQAMYPMGREQGLLFGANIIMPMVTPTYVREQYQLYDGKPCLDEFSSDCFECIQRRIESTGREVSLNEWGDSKHFKSKSQVQ